MDRETLYKLFCKNGFKQGVEIGVETGLNAVDMFKYIPGLRLYLVDPFRNEETIKNTEHYDAIPIKMKSEQAAPLFKDNSLDFVYIDGDHSYDAVMLDLILWGKKVKHGGIISGHDYRIYRGLGVKEAVDDYVKYHRLKLILSAGRNWYWYKI